MSLPAAHRFLQLARRPGPLREALHPGLGYPDLVALGEREGLSFTEEELREAFRLDFRMRLAPPGPPGPSPS